MRYFVPARQHLFEAAWVDYEPIAWCHRRLVQGQSENREILYRSRFVFVIHTDASPMNTTPTSLVVWIHRVEEAAA